MRSYRSFGLTAAWFACAIGVIIQGGILHQSRKDEQKADADEEVHSSDVGDARQRRARHRAQRGHGQHCRYA